MVGTAPVLLEAAPLGGDETMMATLEEEIGLDRRILDSEAEAMSGALSALPLRQRWVTLTWILRELSPALELHFRKEKEVLFPALRRLLGDGAGAVTLLEESQDKLRQGVRHLAELLQDWDNLDWDRIFLAVPGFIYMLEEHEEMEQRLLIHVLGTRMGPHEREKLADAFHRVGEKAHEEEGWPLPA